MIMDEHNQNDIFNSENAEEKSNPEKIKLPKNYRLIPIGIFTTILAAYGLNALISFSGLMDFSPNFQDVANLQFSIEPGMGIFLFCVFAPILEELLFRIGLCNGLFLLFQMPAKLAAKNKTSENPHSSHENEKTFPLDCALPPNNVTSKFDNSLNTCNSNRVEKRFSSLFTRRTAFDESKNISSHSPYGNKKAEWAAILLSSLIFAIYHGNIVQGIYAFVMGSLFAWFLLNSRIFYISILMHAAANAAIYLPAVWLMSYWE